MRTIIEICLLWKSATKRQLTWFDIKLAIVSVNAYGPQPGGGAAPTWLRAIANMEQETALPEAWGLFTFELEERVRTWLEA